MESNQRNDGLEFLNKMGVVFMWFLKQQTLDIFLGRKGSGAARIGSRYNKIGHMGF